MKKPPNKEFKPLSRRLAYVVTIETKLNIGYQKERM